MTRKATENNFLAEAKQILVKSTTGEPGGVTLPEILEGADLVEALKTLYDGTGGTSDYVGIMPKHVIAVNPEIAAADEVTGRLYRHFYDPSASQDAYRYMQSQQNLDPQNPVQYFEVSLPAGEFNEEIMLQPYYTIKGNNTVITGPVRSNVLWSYNAILVAMTGGLRYISDCTFLGQLKLGVDTDRHMFTFSNCDFGADIGYEGSGTYTTEDMILLLNCKTRTPATQPSYTGNFALIAQNCVMTGTWQPLYGWYFGCTMMNFVGDSTNVVERTPNVYTTVADTYDGCSLITTTSMCRISSRAAELSSCTATNGELLLGKTPPSGSEVRYAVKIRSSVISLRSATTVDLTVYSSVVTMTTRASSFASGLFNSTVELYDSSTLRIIYTSNNGTIYDLLGYVKGPDIFQKDPSCTVRLVSADDETAVPDTAERIAALGGDRIAYYAVPIAMRSAAALGPGGFPADGNMYSDMNDPLLPCMGITPDDGRDLNNVLEYRWFNRFYGGAGGLATNIIIIDPEGTQDDGKVYTNYPDAYAYMTRSSDPDNTNVKFAVYLPPCKASDSATQIGNVTINDNIVVIGNNTDLAVAVTSLCTLDSLNDTGSGYIRGCKFTGSSFQLGITGDTDSRSLRLVECDINSFTSLSTIGSGDRKLVFDKCKVKLTNNGPSFSVNTDFNQCVIFGTTSGSGYVVAPNHVTVNIKNSVLPSGIYGLCTQGGGASITYLGRINISDCTLGGEYMVTNLNSITNSGTVRFLNCTVIPNSSNTDPLFTIAVSSGSKCSFSHMLGGRLKVAAGQEVLVQDSRMSLETGDSSYTGQIHLKNSSLSGNSAYAGEVVCEDALSWVDYSAESGSGTVTRKDYVKVAFSSFGGASIDTGDSTTRNAVGLLLGDGRQDVPENYKWIDAPRMVTTTAELAAADWSSNTQTVTVAAASTANTIIVSPSPAHFAAYNAAGILCTGQGDGTLTFTCTTVPSTDITVNVVIVAV